MLIRVSDNSLTCRKVVGEVNYLQTLLTKKSFLSCFFFSYMKNDSDPNKKASQWRIGNINKKNKNEFNIIGRREMEVKSSDCTKVESTDLDDDADCFKF